LLFGCFKKNDKIKKKKKHPNSRSRGKSIENFKFEMLCI